MTSRACFSGWNNKSVQLAALKFQLCFTVLEFLVQVSGKSLCTTTNLSPPGPSDQMTKQQKEAEVNQTGLCLSNCLAAYLYVCGTCLRASDRPISCLSLWYLLVCIGATWPARCPGSFSKHDWLADWLTFGLIRVTYRRAAGTHKHMHAQTNINAQAAYSACNWPEPLARTTNHPLISTTVLWVCKTCSLISFTSCFGRAAVFPYF